MKKKTSCAMCDNAQYETIYGLPLCKTCEITLLNALQKRNTPKGIKSIFLQDRNN